MTVNWAIGVPSYSAGGSVAGNIVTFTGGSGYPQTISNGFAITITSATASYPVNIVSCCAGNNLTLQLPATPTATTTALNISFTSPSNPTTPQIKSYISTMT